jgi:hypothetical protein
VSIDLLSMLFGQLGIKQNESECSTQLRKQI